MCLHLGGQDMRMELRDRSGSLDYINHAGQDLLRKVSSGVAEQSAMKLCADLQSLNSRWNQLQYAADERINKYITTRDQLKHLRVSGIRPISISFIARALLLLSIVW
jgi:hypothetical protein